ncbi:OVARIAN TUMOR DOMAIN-containing deubiquitinating enzyme 10 [Linum perenne]
MAAYDHDSDVYQWGMSLLEPNPPYYPGYYGGGDVIQNDYTYHNQTQNHHAGHYVADHYDITDNTHVENDEIIARTLQEDFSQLAVAQSSPYSHQQEAAAAREEVEEDYHRPGYYGGGGSEWPTTSTSYNSSGEESDDHSGSSSSCSSPRNGDERSYSSELTDEYGLDDEVDKRLNQLIPIRHVPKINGEIPSLDEVTSDHERLLNRLHAFGFIEVKVPGDGNCQFRALSDQLYGTSDRHKTVRRAIVKQVCHSCSFICNCISVFDLRSGEWGDHVTLQAAADSYGVKILVMTSFKDTYYIEILPQKQKPKGVIFLSFWAEVHYNSIYFQEASPEPNKKKKRKWLFGKKH